MDATRTRRFHFWRPAQNGGVNLDDASAWVRDRAPSPEERAASRQQIAAIWKAVDGLSERQRTVFLLHFLEGLTSAEIFEVTGISRAAIKVHRFRAIRGVRERLGESK